MASIDGGIMAVQCDAKCVNKCEMVQGVSAKSQF